MMEPKPRAVIGLAGLHADAIHLHFECEDGRFSCTMEPKAAAAFAGRINEALAMWQRSLTRLPDGNPRREAPGRQSPEAEPASG